MKTNFELLKLAAVAISLGLGLAGCSTPKAPGWPQGDERPINATFHKSPSPAASQGDQQ